MIALLMPVDAFAQKNRIKGKNKKAKTEKKINIVAAQSTLAQSSKPQNGNGETLRDAISELDDIFYYNIKKIDLSSSYSMAESIMLDYLNRKYSKMKDDISKYYYNAFYQASEEDNLDRAVDCALKYLMLGGTDDEDVMWRVLVENYAADADIANAQFLLNKFTDVSASRNDAYKGTIKELDVKYADVFHPKTFEDAVKGTWVSLDGKYVIRVDEVNKNEGVCLLHSPITPWVAVKEKGNWVQGYMINSWNTYQELAKSQIVNFDGNERILTSYFCSKKIDNPNTELAKSLYASSREFMAKGLAKSSSSNLKIGEQVALDAAYLGGSFLMNLLANNAAEGGVKDRAYGITLSGDNPQVLDAAIQYSCAEERTTGEKKIIADEETSNRFVKWEESDSLILVYKNTPFFLGSSLSKNDPLLDEYNKIAKRYSFWNPRYLVPNLAIAAGGIAGFILGYKMAENNFDESTGEYINKSKWWLGFGVFIGSMCVPAIVIPVVDKIRRSARDKAFKKLGEQNLEKIRNKAMLSISPEVDIVNSGIGFNAKLTF